MFGILKRFAYAGLLVLGGFSVAMAQDQTPTFYPMPAIAIQYETRNCGYDTVMISTQLEYFDSSMTDRLSAYMPKIMAVVYGEMKKHLNQHKSIEDRKVKEMILHTVNRVVKQGRVEDVLIMNIVHG